MEGETEEAAVPLDPGKGKPPGANGREKFAGNDGNGVLLLFELCDLDLFFGCLSFFRDLALLLPPPPPPPPPASSSAWSPGALDWAAEVFLGAAATVFLPRR